MWSFGAQCESCLHILKIIAHLIKKDGTEGCEGTHRQSAQSLAGDFSGQQMSRIKNGSCRKIKCECYSCGVHGLALLVLEHRVRNRVRNVAESSWKSHYESPFYYLHLLHISYSANLRAVDKNHLFFLHGCFNLETSSSILVFRFFAPLFVNQSLKL